MRTKLLLVASAAVALALPALAQQAAAPPQQPTAPSATPAPAPAGQPAATSTAPGALPEGGADETAVEEISNSNPAAALVPPSPPVEYPGWARRDPWTVGAVDPRNLGLGDEPW